jgi:hypothetical protein
MSSFFEININALLCTRVSGTATKTYKQTNKQTNKQKQTNKHTNKQTNKQTNFDERPQQQDK